jgi:excisionase family DNA binding protein
MDIGIVETSKLLKVSPRTVRRWVHQGKLKAATVKGRYGSELRVDLLQLLKDRGINPKNVPSPCRN